MIRGRHVSIRTMEVEDLATVKSINDDPVVRGNVVGWGWPNSHAEVQRWYAGSQGGSTHRWIVEDDNGNVIGVTGLWDVDLRCSNALTALKLGGAKSVRGQGLGTDAIKLTMAFAFYDVGLSRLYTTILATNEASLRAYVDKCGWKREGVARRHTWRHGNFVDLVHVGVLREEFDELEDAQFYIDCVAGRRDS